jgi:outer membrane lipoprotein-sorting protein
MSAQFDPSAQKYLDQLAETVQSAEGLVIHFEAKVSNISGEEEMNNKEGKLLLKQKYHKLEIADSETYGDGENQWVFFPEDEEVTIQPIEEGELTPASIFTIYKKGYRFRLLGENENKVVVELSPEAHKSSYVRITLYIDIAKQQLDAFAAQGKNGMVTSVNITQWEIKALEDAQVRFNADQHPDIDIIDLR